jgi:hypothetical protein
MTFTRSLFALAGTFALVASSLAFSAETCCDKAKAKGGACKHPCCVAATKLRTTCFKCNPGKAKTCCDKALAKASQCKHPCCVKAQKVGVLCFKCNKGCPIALFDGKSLANWTTSKKSGKEETWVVGKPVLSKKDPHHLTVEKGTGAFVNSSGGKHGAGRDFYSKAVFGDALIEVEVMVPKGSNSGVYVMGEYEIQVLDSWGKTKLGNGDMGAVYGASPPPFNACKKPGEWQKYEIEFRAPRFDDKGKKTENARFLSVKLNGKLLHKNLVLKGATPGGVDGKEKPLGPLMFQGNHGEVAYRNIFVTPR